MSAGSDITLLYEQVAIAHPREADQHRRRDHRHHRSAPVADRLLLCPPCPGALNLGHDTAFAFACDETAAKRGETHVRVFRAGEASPATPSWPSRPPLSRSSGARRHPQALYHGPRQRPPRRGQRHHRQRPGRPLQGVSAAPQPSHHFLLGRRIARRIFISTRIVEDPKNFIPNKRGPPITIEPRGSKVTHRIYSVALGKHWKTHRFCRANARLCATCAAATILYRSRHYQKPECKTP